MYFPDWPKATMDAVEDILTPESVVYEWGTGYSTIWFANRCKKLYTMEHDDAWFDRIRDIARHEAIENIDFSCYYLHDARYYKSIHKVPEKIDLIIVDGRNRIDCFEQAVKVANEPIIMLDDSERERYRAAFDMGLKLMGEFNDQKGQRSAFFKCKK